MAKPHKYAWNGVDVETALGIEQLANMAQRAAQECTGDLWHGKHRIASVRSTDRQIEFRINDYLITFKKFMVFYLDFEVRDGRTWLSSRIAWYVTTQPTVGGFIPAGAKTMVGHHTYMQFAHHLADQVRAADPQARVTLREGMVSTAVPAAATAQARASAAPAQPTAAVTPAPTPQRAPAPPMPAVTPPWAQSSVPPPPLAAVRPGAFVPPPPPPMPAMAPPIPTPGRSTQPSSGLVTSVPGMPVRENPAPPSVEVEPTGFASIAEQLFAEDEDLFHTRMVQQGGEALPWSLRLPDGSELLLERTVVLGRHPAVPDGATGAATVDLDDPNRSVSKTHAMIELRDAMPWVTDLHSTNGTTLTNDVGEALLCQPGTPMPVGDGWSVGLGEYSIAVARRSARG